MFLLYKNKMFKSKIFVIAVLIACANSRHLFKEHSRSYLIFEDSDNISMYVLEEQMSEGPKLIEQDSVSRVRRQAYSNINTNPEEISILGIKIPSFAGAANKILYYLPSVIKTAGDGLTLDRVNKIGGSLGTLYTDLLKKMDLSAIGNLNLFKDHSLSLDLKAGFKKPMSPYNPNSRWRPFGGLSFTRFF